MVATADQGGGFRHLRSSLIAALSGFGLVLTPGCSAVAPSSTDEAATRFVRDPARFKANQERLVAAIRGESPAIADALEQSFKQDILGTIAPELRRLGLNSSDVADMTAVYWVNAWEASNGIVGKPSDPALVAGARRQIATTLAKDVARLSDADKQDIADAMLLQGLLVDARMQAAAAAGEAAQSQMSDTIHAEAAQLLRTDLRQVKLTAAGFGSATGPSAASGSAVAPQAASDASHAGNWQLVEGVYFQSNMNFGVGGLMVQDFQPLILFRDGSYYEVEGPALEDVDLAASRASDPRAWGRWTRQGESYQLTDDRNHTETYKLQDGSFFKALPAEAIGGKLARTYKRISGGGNSAMGGTLAIAAQTEISFTLDGRFSHSSSAGASGADVAAHSGRSGDGGRYRIDRHTISFVNSDGSAQRQFFALSSQGAELRVDSDMVFIGDRVFIKDD